METAVGTPLIKVRYGASASRCRDLNDGRGFALDLAVPLLGGPAEEILFRAEMGELCQASAGLRIYRGASNTAGVAVIDGPESLEDKAFQVYAEILSALGGHSLYRVWNFVPFINKEPGGLENYRAFNVGRWTAFRDFYGEAAMNSRLPAASAVGIRENSLAVAFLAGDTPVAYIENPQQMPAYQYPPDYGLRSPSFARAAVVGRPGMRVGYMSGTSSIRGHETVGTGDLLRQFEVTTENIARIREVMDMQGDAVKAGYRVYVRNAEEYEALRDRFFEKVPDAQEETLFLHADICRKALKLEVEGVFRDSR